MKEISGHFVFVANVCLLMKLKTKDGEQHYKLRFVIDGERGQKDHGQKIRHGSQQQDLFFLHTVNAQVDKMGLANTLLLLSIPSMTVCT